jgi:hypothetical protein
MRKFIINESQIKTLLREFMQDGFSLSSLDSLPHGERVRYCRQYLGEPIGVGCGRVVFEIGDDTVLKVCYGYVNKQNKQEYLNYISAKENYDELIDLFPKVYKTADDYSWIECERVLPFDKQDSKKILGLPYKDNNYPSLVGFIDWAEYNVGGNVSDESDENQLYERLIQEDEWFMKIYKYIELQNGAATDLIDDNFGLALRNGKPHIVILDSGSETL